MFLKTPINWWFIAFLGVLTASLWATHTMRVNSAVKHATASVTASMNSAYQTKLDKAVADAIEATKKLQQAADKLKENKYATLETINRKLSADVVGLQQRAQRPADTSIIADNTSVRATCTAAQLYREDAEFLAREAARADSVVIERDYYYDRYISIEKSLNGKR
jgi:hypothetical protein